MAHLVETVRIYKGEHYEVDCDHASKIFFIVVTDVDKTMILHITSFEALTKLLGNMVYILQSHESIDLFPDGEEIRLYLI